MKNNFIEIYKVNKKICDELIFYFKKNTEYKNEGTIGIGKNNSEINKEIKESIDVTFFNSSNDITIKKFFIELNKCFNSYIKLYNLNEKLWTHNSNLIQYYPPNGGYKTWHYENPTIETSNRKLVYMLYLNDIKNGGTEWLYQNIKLNAVKGDLVIWPASFTHTHKGTVINKEKYIVTGWFENK